MSLRHVCTCILTVYVAACHGWQEVSSPAYLARSAAEKADIIWANVLEDTSPGGWYGPLELPGLFTEDMCPTLRAPGDELPWEDGWLEDGTRYKYIHTVGTVARVEWRDRGGHPYTGIFAGASSGFVRLSLANEPSPPAPGTAPGMGLKFLRDGRDSANLVAMYSVDGQDSWNFFKNDFTNHIAAGSLALLPVSVKFSKATNYIQQVGLSEWASHAEDGTAASTPTFPFMLRFRPSGEVPSFPDEYVNDWLEDLMSVPAGTTLYQVWALDAPEELGGVETHIGDLVLTSELTSSNWGDKHLYFRHQDMAEDVALVPAWEQFLDKFGLEHESGCPVAGRRRGRRGDHL